MTNATTKAIAHVLRRWHENEPKPAQVIDFAAARREREHRKPTPPQAPNGGRAA